MSEPQKKPGVAIWATVAKGARGSWRAANVHTPENMRADGPQSDCLSKQRFPRRALWLQERLKERDWDWNEPYRCGGPDRKTVKKILDGKLVRPDMLRKLILALNHKKTGKTLSALDIPSD
jgi:hypothetical protein